MATFWAFILHELGMDVTIANVRPASTCILVVHAGIAGFAAICSGLWVFLAFSPPASKIFAVSFALFILTFTVFTAFGAFILHILDVLAFFTMANLRPVSTIIIVIHADFGLFWGCCRFYCCCCRLLCRSCFKLEVETGLAAI